MKVCPTCGSGRVATVFKSLFVVRKCRSCGFQKRLGSKAVLTYAKEVNHMGNRNSLVLGK